MTTANDTLIKERQSLSVFEQLEQPEHEQVVFCFDKQTGLRAIIAIHNTILGPALGGTRMWNYASEADGLTDVLRLSRGMTLKAAISGINLGGGKAVILGDPYNQKSEALWRRYGRFVDSLDGKYITAEDVGTSTRDIEFISMETEFVAGKPAYLGGGGDPSPVTAYGTYLGMKAAASKTWGNDGLAGKTILIQGVGHVGQCLTELLVKEDAKVLVSDINSDSLKSTTAKYKVDVVESEAIFNHEMDIYAPCALGATLNDNTIPQLKCRIVAGSANNQLDNEGRHSQMLQDQGILYAPDFLINAGGLINCYAELDGYSRDRAFGYTDKIYDRTLEIIERASAESISTHEAAVRIATQRMAQMAQINSRL